LSWYTLVAHVYTAHLDDGDTDMREILHNVGN